MKKRYDWSKVNWHQSDKSIIKIYGCSAPAVSLARKRLAPETVGKFIEPRIKKDNVSKQRAWQIEKLMRKCCPQCGKQKEKGKKDRCITCSDKNQIALNKLRAKKRYGSK